MRAHRCNVLVAFLSEPDPAARWSRSLRSCSPYFNERRYYLDARQPQPSEEAEKAAAEKEEAPEKRVPQPVDAEALLREAEEQAGDQVQHASGWLLSRCCSGTS